MAAQHSIVVAFSTAAPRTPIAPRASSVHASSSTGGATSAAPPSAVIVLASIARIRRHSPSSCVQTSHSCVDAQSARHAAASSTAASPCEIATADQRDASA